MSSPIETESGRATKRGVEGKSKSERPDSPKLAQSLLRVVLHRMKRAK